MYLSEENHLIEGAYELLENLSRDYRIIIITNGLSFVQNNRFNKSTIKKFINYIIISEEIGFQKPQKEIFHLAISKENISHNTKVLMIGDSLNSDIKGGNNAGLHTCWYNPKKEINNTCIFPTYEINVLNELYGILEYS